MPKFLVRLMLVAPLALLTACAANGVEAAGPGARTFPLIAGDGSSRGSISASDSMGGLMVMVSGMGLPPGVHGMHIHSVGKCEGPAFASAGAHFNPSNRQHGTENPMGAHVGDLPNITVAADGTVSFEATVPGAALASLADTDGAAVVIHAGPDDYKTDPSGNSGVRIACAVIAPAK